MSKGNKILKISKKILRFLGFIFIALFISVNLFIVLSGRFYLYKGISYTYLSGKTGPTIYDLNVFPSSTIKKSKRCYQWKKNSKFNTQSIPKKYNDLLLKLDTKAFLVFKGDEILFEKYWGQHKKETVSNCFSAAKTVVSLLIGAALDEGKIKSFEFKGKSNWSDVTSQYANKDELFRGALFDVRGYNTPLAAPVIKESYLWGRKLLGLDLEEAE